MGWRSKPRTLNEELLAEGPRVAESPLERPHERSRLIHVAVCAATALVIVGLKLGVAHLPAWIGLALGTVFVGHYVSIFVGSTKKREGATAGKGLRAFLLLWLAICVVATVLIALGGFQPDDRALLGFIWPMLGLIWVVYRLRASKGG
jgi:hypothetical protein